MFEKLIGGSRMDRVTNEKMCIRAGIVNELASTVDERVLR